MDETPRQRLARLVAGIPANSSPMPNFANGVNAPPSAMPNPAENAPPFPSGMPNFAAPGSSSAYLPPLKMPPPVSPDTVPGYARPYTGLKNDLSLPAFEQPGSSLPFERYYQPPELSPPPQPPQAAPVLPPSMAPAAAPPPVQVGGQGWGGPEPAPGTMAEPYDPMKDPRYLPEQWAGAFNPRWQK